MANVSTHNGERYKSQITPLTIQGTDYSTRARFSQLARSTYYCGGGAIVGMHSPHAGQPGASRGVPKSRRRRTPFVLLSYLIVRIGDRTSRGHYPHTIPVALSAYLPDVCGYKQRYSSTLAGIWLRPQAPGFAEEVSWTDRIWTQLPDMYADIRKAIPSSLVVYGWEALYTPACEM